MESIDYLLLYRIAKEYYLDGLTQQEIANHENISRPHVSRMLSKAREQGIVTIKLDFPHQANLELLQSILCERLGLKEVRVARVSPENRKEPRAISLGIATMASASMKELLQGAHTVGVGWGRTIYQTALLMEHTAMSAPLSFVPLVGLSGENNPYLQINVIVDRFAEKCGANSIYTIMPAILDTQARLGNIEEGSYLRLRQQWDCMDVAVIGLGAAPKDGQMLVSEASEEYHRQVAQSGTVGDILANFFYPDGSIFDTSAHYRNISMSPQALSRIPTVICLAGGGDKVEGIIAAARNRFFNILITDDTTAERILARLNEGK